MKHKVDADKGFAYSGTYSSYISQRKNHFQITLQTLVDKTAKYVFYNGQLYEIDHFELHIYAVKSEFKSDRIEIRQSNIGDRRHLEYKPMCIRRLEVNNDNHITAKRLHFGQITKNNKCINHMPNPKQRFFNLVVELKVTTLNQNSFLIYAAESENIIVRVRIVLFLNVNYFLK